MKHKFLQDMTCRELIELREVKAGELDLLRNNLRELILVNEAESEAANLLRAWMREIQRDVENIINFLNASHGINTKIEAETNENFTDGYCGA